MKTKVVTLHGLQIEQTDNGKNMPVQKTEELRTKTLNFRTSLHEEGTIVFNIQKFGDIYTSFGMHLTKAQASAIGGMLRRLGDDE